MAVSPSPSFRLPVVQPPYPFRIGPGDRGLALGSCFADHIGRWLADGRLPLCVNPFGALYNPASVVQALERLASGEPFRESDLFEHNGLWHSFAHHSDFSGPDAAEVSRRIEMARAEGVRALREARYLMLTFGTAWVYEREGRPVANCHKLPARLFTRRRLTVDEIVEPLALLLERWPDRQTILTVSPVIHRGDGLVENQLSKSTLILAAHRLAERFAGRVHYFPAYEIVTGELRDYRFYADDMCHPSSVAIEYIRRRFSESLLTVEAAELVSAVGELRRAMEHRPLHPGGEEYAAFRQTMRRRAEEAQARYPTADFSEELQFFA
ncbi:GSCFA domain-containing protein [uncultured Rikenella sp.]|uniref:GSCFA domain-containing protein n=1 Tax=uncultured Rikenella sp. TaxID=368003 RepID=UPI0025DE3461|nr:GSCFA domain-containing protein [uncultured Rikenella sp.]